MKLKKLFLAVLLAGFGTSLVAQNVNEGIKFMENEPWETVLAAAKQQNRLIFIDCYTTWCGPCKALSEKIFPLKEVGDFFNANFVNAKYDMEKGDGEMLHKKYKENIIGFPTMLLINANGEVVHQMAGYMEADALISNVKAGLEGRSLFAMKKKYDSGAKDFQTITDYVAALKSAHKQDEIARVMNDYLESIPDEDLLKPEVWAFAGEYIKDPYSPKYRFVIDNIERGFQYGLKVDRYKLENQLGTAMSRAVSDIIKTTANTKDADTIRMMRENTEHLLDMTTKNTVKRFSDYSAKLLINRMMIDGKPVEIYNMLVQILPTGLLASDSYFLSDAYGYIMENVKDKKIVRDCLAKVIAMQDEATSKNVVFARNFYDKIAIGYAKLGDKAKAKEARDEYDNRREATRKYWREQFGLED